MARSDVVDFCCELLAPVGAPRARRMFGGHGIYVDEVFVAIVVADELYLKTDATTRPRFEAAGGRPFAYVGRDGEPTTTGYWSPPPDAMESPAAMAPWGRLALQAALAARVAPRRRRASRRAGAG